MKVEEARKTIKSLNNYVGLYEQYEPKTIEQEAIKKYCEIQSVTKVAAYMNDQGYKVGSRKFIANDISDILKQKPFIDELHELANKMFYQNKKGNKWLG